MIFRFNFVALIALLACGLSGQTMNLVIAQESGSSDEQLWCTYPGGEGVGAGKHIVLISGDDEYRSEEAMPMLGKILSKHHGFKCTVLFPINPEDNTIKPDYQTNIPGMKFCQEADLIIMGLRFRNLPNVDMKYLDDFLQAGKPVIGVRTSTHAFNIPKDSDSYFKRYSFNYRDVVAEGDDPVKPEDSWRGGFGQRVLGDTWISHHGRHKSEATRGINNPLQANHPILRGVYDVFGPTDVYGIRNLPKSV